MTQHLPTSGSSPDQQSINEDSYRGDNSSSTYSCDISLSSHERREDEQNGLNDCSSSSFSYNDSYFSESEFFEDNYDCDSDISEDHQSTIRRRRRPPPPPPIRHRLSRSLNRNRRFRRSHSDETDLFVESQNSSRSNGSSNFNNSSENCSSFSFDSHMDVSQRRRRLKASIQSLSQRTFSGRCDGCERIWNSDNSFVYFLVCICIFFGAFMFAYSLYHHDKVERMDTEIFVVPTYVPITSAPSSERPISSKFLSSHEPSRSRPITSPSDEPSYNPTIVPSSMHTISFNSSSSPTEKRCTCSPRVYHWTLDLSTTGCPLSIAERNGIQGQSTCGYSNNEQGVQPMAVSEISIKELVPWTFDVYKEHIWQNETLMNGANLSFVSLTDRGIIIGGLEGRIKANNTQGEFEHFFKVAFSNTCEILPFGVGDSLGFLVFTQVSEPIHTSCYYKTTSFPSMSPSSSPTQLSSSTPSNLPSSYPTLSPTFLSSEPTSQPSQKASVLPSAINSSRPSELPNTAYTWVPLGNNIYGNTALQEYGKSVAISKDGKVMAVSQHRDDSIDVYDYDNDNESWIKRNLSIKGESGSGMGQIIAMSKNGTRIAGAGTKWNDERGVVQVWDWDGMSWNQVGYSFRGINAKDTVGVSLAMSSDGNHLIIGAGDYESNDRRGSVIIFLYDGLNWVKKGYHITGSNQYDYMGSNPDSVSVTNDGNYIAMGAQAASYVKVFFWDDNMWKLLGIIDHDDYTWFGISVELLAVDGKLIIAIGSPKDSPKGSIYVYEWKSNRWIERPGSPIRVEDAEAIGFSLALSSDGNTVMSQSYKSPFVFDWNGTHYNQRGGPIFTAGDEDGKQLPVVGVELNIDMSGSGNIIVVGLPFDEVGWLSCPCEGHTRSFAWKRP